MTAGRVSFLSCAALATLGLVAWTRVVPEYLVPTPFDDAYTYARYARHFLDGQGFSWNPGEGPAFGCTSPLYLFLVTGVRAVSEAADSTLLPALSTILGVFAAVGLTVFAWFVLDPGLRRGGVPLLVLPALLLSPLMLYHGSTGMETTTGVLTNVLLLGAAYGLAARPSLGRMLLCVVSAWLSFGARPDSAIYGVLVPPLLLLARDRSSWRWALGYLLGFVLAWTADAGLRVALFGSVLPTPFYVKEGSFLEGYRGMSYWNGGEYLVVVARGTLPFLALVGLTRRSSLARVGALLAPVLVFVAWSTTVLQIMGLEARYYVPSVPFVVAAGLVALDGWNRAPARSAWIGPRMGVVGVVWAVVACTPLQDGVTRWWGGRFIHGQAAVEARARYETPSARPLPALGWWQAILRTEAFVSRLPEDTVLAMSEHGRIGATFWRMRILDLAALHDRSLARGGLSPDTFFAQAPDVIWFPHSDYSGLRAAILDSPQFQASYDWFPGVLNYGVALRIDSPQYETAYAALDATVREVYPGRVLEEERAVLR